MRKKKIYCPLNGWDCPYYKKGECGIENPIKNVMILAIFGMQMMIIFVKMRKGRLLKNEKSILHYF